MHAVIEKLSDQQKIECYEMALRSCLQTLMCLPADQVLKGMIRRDLYAQIERRGLSSDAEVNAPVHAAIHLFS